ncbi:MAG: guanylate kinase [Burkholderiaceae bacterium]|nr:guanylate kinase [Burkholderiaceae bacterium]
MASSSQTGGTLFVVTAPSGTGKTSLIKALMEKETDLGLSISHTTRPPRRGEENGREYHFISVEDFCERKERGEFLEWAEVYGNLYGTSRQAVLERVSNGKDTLLEIDWQGAMQIRRLLPEAVSIFILPPSIPTLEDRLKKRGLDTPESIARRMQTAQKEMSHASRFDYVIINDEFDTALFQLIAVVTAINCRFTGQAHRNARLFKQLGVA